MGVWGPVGGPLEEQGCGRSKDSHYRHKSGGGGVRGGWLKQQQQGTAREGKGDREGARMIKSKAFFKRTRRGKVRVLGVRWCVLYAVTLIIQHP